MKHEALIRNGPWLTNSDVVQLFVLGHERETHMLLDDYLPRLELWLSENVNSEFLPMDRIDLPKLARDLSFGIWLRDGASDKRWAQFAFEKRLAYSTAAKDIPEGPELTSLLLLALEAGADEKAQELYQAYHKKPYSLIPGDMRFANGPQHLMALVSRFEEDTQTREKLLRGLKQFASRASAWDRRIDPVPYVHLDTLTRIVVQCAARLGQNLSRQALWSLVR